MNDGRICVSVCAGSVDELAQRVREAEPVADVIEARLDCLPADEIHSALSALRFSKPILLTFRPVEQGGHSGAGRETRLAFWRAVFAGEGQRTTHFLYDLEHDIIDEFPGKGVIGSFHDFSGVPDGLEQIFERLSTECAVTKIAFAAEDITDTIPVWKLLRRANSEHKKVVAIAMGESGKATRILGPALGAAMTYASFGDAGTAPGQIGAAELRDLYRVHQLDGQTAVFGIIGGNTTYSQSPLIHNAFFRENGINAVFVPLQTRNVGEFIRRMVRPGTREIDLNFHGFAVTIPHKQAIIAHLDEVHPSAAAIGAVNTVQLVDGRLLGFNTDADGFIWPLTENFGPVAGVEAAVIGAGGAARACVWALASRGAKVTVFARDTGKASALERDFGVAVRRLGTDAFGGFEIVVNTTPLGTLGVLASETPAVAAQLEGVRLAYDLVYNPAETRFLREAAQAGAGTLGGSQMLAAQARRQQEIWTEQLKSKV